MTFLSLQSVSKRYGNVVALDDVDLEVSAGSRTAVVGPSGSGKTTLLRMIAGFDAPDSGRVILDGQLLADGPRSIPAHRRGIGLVAQDGALFPHLSVTDNIGFALPRGEPRRDEQIVHLMTMVELDTALMRRRPDQLSGGQQQRVALARALACKPRLMLLDEPFSALDTALRAATRKAVADLLSGAGITTILVTHDQAEALSFADQVAVMGNGRLLQVGAPRDLYLQPRDPLIAEFLGQAIVLPAQLAAGWAECDLGRVAVNQPLGCGAARIMLRPEQIVLEQAPGGTTQSDGPLGEVTEVDFGGPICTVAVRLLNGGGQGQRAGDHAPILFQRSSIGLPPIGAIVRIKVIGTAHVFDSASETIL